MNRRTIVSLSILGVSSVGFAGKEIQLEITRAEGAAVAQDTDALSRLREPTTRDLSDTTAAVFEDAFTAMGVDDVPESEIEIGLWPPYLAICAEPEGGYQTCCVVSTTNAYCTNSSTD